MSRIGPDRWPLVSPYLDQALDFVDQRERAAWLASLRERDAPLAADLDALLQEHHALRDDRFLEPVVQFAPPEIAAGATVGAYTVLSPIGRGGMGAVWLAERNDGRFERRVAIKFLTSLVGGQDRFRREGRILARLAHRHIAQLLDAGVSATGQPYLVLEHIDGEPIDRYCDRHTLDVHARLRLFLDVLDAVAHAHASLIVHRDIKPSNVLVTDHGRVKLLDFGIAKLLEDEERGAATVLTLDGAAAWTPAYAAPEQVTGQPVSTATDVYALGVLLYVLLTGRHPAGEREQSPAALVKAIVDTEPLRPSALVMRAGTGDTASARRAVSPDKLQRLLSGDIDTIVATALKKNPAERFASVTAFADDIHRFLRHEPIAARPDSISYRGAKFVRRNRLAVAAVALVVASLTVGLYAANRERAVAERRFMQVRQLANRVLALDVEMRPLPGSTKARYEIVAMAKEYLEALRPDAEADPALALEIGMAYSLLAVAQGVPTAQNLGQYDQAEESLRTADALFEYVLTGAPRNRTALIQSAQAAQSRMILADSGGRQDETLTYARKAVGRLDALLGSGPLTSAEADSAARLFANIALAHKNAQLYPEAIHYARRSMAILPSGPRANEQRAQASSIMADSMRLSGDLEAALHAIRQARQDLERADARDAITASTVFNVLWREGVILGEEGRISLGRSSEAIAVLQQAFDHLEEWAAKDAHNASSRMLFASAGRELGNLLRERDPRRALAIYDRALLRLSEVKDNAKARRGEVDLLTGSTYPLRQLGRSVEAGERLDAAFARLQQLKTYRSEQVELGSETDAALRARADHEADTGDLARAIETYRMLLDAVAAAAAPNINLTHAADLSRLLGALAELHRRAGNEALASGLDARRVELWQHWASKLPGNPFVTAQLAAAGSNSP